MTLVKYQGSPVKSIFDDFFFRPAFEGPVTATPAVNIAETDQGFTIELAAPGFDKADFNIKVEKNNLVISAQKDRKEEENGPVYRRKEFSFARIERSFRLPETVDADQVNATLNNGILQVTLPKKAEAVPAVKTIEVA